ncbi:MAG: NADP-dependent oxidoreductase [Desulfatitalea sp.]|nr:NADP-dependent oxidoreductase [Desulfatitalea sp.]MBI5897066.1 NADP-dependent oxidoreductase [Desulfobacterales bacterium]
MAEKNIQVLLARRPEGEVRTSDFNIVETPLPQIADGQLLVRNHYLSLDPYMRGRMSGAKSYAQSVAIGQVMVGGTVGQVVASRHGGFREGDHVLGAFGWQLYGVSDGTGLTKLDAQGIPLSAYLGVLGMPGVTAYVGLMDIGQPKSGETVVVSAASGAVGSVVGQIAKIKGCHAVGIAGGPEKCTYVTNQLGFDACIDHKQGRLAEDLARAAPKGIDVYFENVGGAIFDTVLARMNPFGRIPLCGLISQYNALEPYGLKNIGSLLINRVKLQGFIISDHFPRWSEALKNIAQWMREGRIKYRESITQGIENAPAAFIGLLAGKNFGKQVVKLI